MICPLGFSFDNNLCKRDISRIIQSKFEGPYPSWKKTDPAVREMWYGEFKSRQFGRLPTQAELFLVTHGRKNNSGFVDRRSEDTYANFQTRQHEASSQLSAVGHSEDSDVGQPSHLAIDDRSLWLEVAGGKKKGCVYGMGLEAHIIPGSYYVPTPQPPPQPSSSVSLSNQIQEAVWVAIERTLQLANLGY
ncbi:uncharacterized protein LOC127798870 [Diospyros lotus]|uniref:uncharacterized protein LOC127798870 n=1 Tax=Diospyros lotus TaxID=55363 RepID=UPI002255FF5B|nr:uncharacterized protein LOC127798870 [Diospyros lotus]XP_052188470.1 uncharacterized protein LOC127798870 [Diospyros lotus]